MANHWEEYYIDEVGDFEKEIGPDGQETGWTRRKNGWERRSGWWEENSPGFQRWRNVGTGKVVMENPFATEKLKPKKMNNRKGEEGLDFGYSGRE